jgi:hypothetical protein
MSTETIPGPPGLPIVGNIADIDSETPLHSFERLTDIYGKSESIAVTHSLLKISRPDMEIQLGE